MGIRESIDANKKSAKDNAWGVLPGSDVYAGPGDPALLPDIAATNAIAGFGGGDVVTKELVEALNGDAGKGIREAAKASPAAQRFLDNVDLNPKTTFAINAGLGFIAGAGTVADHVMVPRPKQLVR